MNPFLRFYRKLFFRYTFGRTHHIGFLPSSEKIQDYIRDKGTLVGIDESTDAAYEIEGVAYSAYQRKEIVTRRTYIVDGLEYAQCTVRKQNG